MRTRVNTLAHLDWQPRVAALLAGRWAPVALAVAFGLLSIPVVAASFLQVPPKWGGVEDAGWQAIEAPEALLLAAACALGAAIVGGGVGGRLVRTRPTEATLVAVGTSWPVGIILLPAVAAAFGIRLRTAVFCFDVCTVSLTDANPLSGIGAYVLALLMGVLLVLPPIVALVLLLAAFGTPARGRFFGSVLVVAAYAVLHLWTLSEGGIPFACLAIGAVVWASLLRTAGAAPSAPALTVKTGSRRVVFWGLVTFLVLLIAWLVLQAKTI